MSIAFLGDMSFAKILSSPQFKSKFMLAHSFYHVSSMTTLSSYQHLLPSDMKYVVLGCLQPILMTLNNVKGEKRESTIRDYKDMIKQLN